MTFFTGTEREKPELDEATRSYYALIALSETQEGLADNQILLPDQAQYIGGLFASYALEWHIHFGDIVRPLGREAILGSLLNPTLIGEAERALHEVLGGNYAGLKRLLLGESFIMWVGTAGLRQSLERLVASMPDQGDPFVPPLPAWQDPQFNQYPSTSSFFKNP